MNKLQVLNQTHLLLSFVATRVTFEPVPPCLTHRDVGLRQVLDEKGPGLTGLVADAALFRHGLVLKVHVSQKLVPVVECCRTQVTKVIAATIVNVGHVVFQDGVEPELGVANGALVGPDRATFSVFLSDMFYDVVFALVALTTDSAFDETRFGVDISLDFNAWISRFALQVRGQCV